MLRSPALLSAAILSGAASAQTIFFDDFESEAQTGNVLNYNSFINWDVTDGTVDLWTGFGGNGQIVDLDGSTADAGLFSTKTSFNLNAGTAYRVSWRMSGNQRVSSPDTVDVSFGGATNSFVVNRDDPWTEFSFLVTPASAMSSKLSFQNSGGDNFGAWIDEVEIEAVPEPGTLALLAFGGALIARRRRSQG
jgi:hypothetical protein